MIIRRFRILIFAALVILLVLFAVKLITEHKSNPQPQNAQKEQPTPQVKGIETSSNRSVYLGLWTQGFWDPATNTLHPEALTKQESKIGKHAAIAHYYRGWEALDSSNLLNELQTISASGWRPMISANPYFFAKCLSNSLPLYRAIANGNCDEFLTNAGKNLKQFGKPIFLRFAWEMNIPSIDWQIAKTGSTNADFIAAWQRMHNIIYSQGATNVLWVFSPDVGNVTYRDIYPGDSFVDWVALDGYNWGSSQPWSKWQSASEVFSQAYRQITAIAPNKPLMLAEVNTTDKGGDKPAWYQDLLATQIPLNFPKIKAVVFYNEDRTKEENVNWLIDISKASLDSFSKYIGSPIYRSSF